MKPAWQAWIERWLGVDATFLAAAAAHIVLSWLLPWLKSIYWLTSSLSDDVWTACIGWIASSAAILGAWTACGPGRLAVRCFWAVLLSLVNWFAVARSIWAPHDIWSLVIAAVSVFAGVLSVTTAMTLRLGWGIRLTRANTIAIETAAKRWQFSLADLLLFMVVAAIVVSVRLWLEDFAPIFYEFRRSAGAEILYAIRLGGALCAATVLAGALLLPRDIPRVTWTILACATTTTSVALLGWLMFGEPIFGSLAENLRMYGVGAAGSLLATLATLLPLRAWGWRCVRIHRAATPPPAAA